MDYPKGENLNEQHFLDGLRGTRTTPADWERYLVTYRKLGRAMARRQANAEQELVFIAMKLKEAN